MVHDTSYLLVLRTLTTVMESRVVEIVDRMLNAPSELEDLGTCGRCDQILEQYSLYFKDRAIASIRNPPGFTPPPQDGFSSKELALKVNENQARRTGIFRSISGRRESWSRSCGKRF